MGGVSFRLSQKASTLARSKPIRQALGVLDDPAPILLVHKPPADTHVPRVIPDPS